MSSTEFTVGLDGSRVSSKVLKPPGGGSSDIFGLGSSHLSTNGGVVTEKNKNPQVPTNSKERLFGNSNNVPSSPAKTYRMQSNLFGSDNELPSKPKKKFVRRNPITGEEIEIDPESYQKTETEEKNEEEENTDEVESLASRHVQTSIRVRNPPGGKSSGIF